MIDPEETDGQSASRAASVQSTVGALSSNAMSEFAHLVAELIGGAQSQMASSSKVNDGDRHL